MQHQLEEAYQKAVALAEAYKARDVHTLSDVEKNELSRILKQIDVYTPIKEPATMITELP